MRLPASTVVNPNSHRPLIQPYTAACVQLCSDEDTKGNLDRAELLIRRAAEAGAKLIATPEATPLLGPQFHKVDRAESVEGLSVKRLSALAQELGIHLLLGSIAERRLMEDGSVDQHRCYNTSVFINPEGEVIATYRKIHLFDVDVRGKVTIRESDSVEAGDQIVVVETPLGKIGLSICYDVRFPELYRALVDRGAELIMVPSAFTSTTGKDHWHPLLKARAIECQAWVIAPAQWGQHDEGGKRVSYGHSLIIDPWGIVKADAGHGEGICLAEIDVNRVHEVRGAVPVQEHRRL